jgi:hypothetical protein
MQTPSLDEWPDAFHPRMTLRLAEAFNTLDPSLLLPYLSDTVCWYSQITDRARGRGWTVEKLHSALKYFRETPRAHLCAELAVTAPLQSPRTVFGVHGLPCVRLEQYIPKGPDTINEGVVLVHLRTEQDKIQQINISHAIPSPQKAWRLGLYPWTDR